MDSTLLKEALETHGANFSSANKLRLALGASRHRDRADAVFDRITQVAIGAITTEEFGADIGRRIRNQHQLERGMAENKWEGSGGEKRGKTIPDAPVPADFFDKLYTEMQTWRR